MTVVLNVNSTNFKYNLVFFFPDELLVSYGFSSILKVAVILTSLVLLANTANKKMSVVETKIFCDFN